MLEGQQCLVCHVRAPEVSTKSNLWGCSVSTLKEGPTMVRGGGEAYRDTLWCWRFYLQKEFIACFLSLPLIVLVCESMTRRLAEG